MGARPALSVFGVVVVERRFALLACAPLPGLAQLRAPTGECACLFHACWVVQTPEHHYFFLKRDTALVRA